MGILRLKYCLLLVIALSCSEFVEIDPPRTDLVGSTVFTNDETASAAIRGIYYQMSSSGFASGDASSVSFLASLSSDELINFSTTSTDFQQFNDNLLTPNTDRILTLWSQLYQVIFKANAVIEGLKNANEISVDLKKQLEGEAKFIRAFSHFYLVNLYGNIPLVLTTDYQENSKISRNPVSEVYDQIIIDLKDAQDLLKDLYETAPIERVRVDWGAVTALLARVYLYIEDWPNAEMQATSLINANAYTLETNVNDVFLKESSEAIWQLSNDINNTKDATTFIFNESQLAILHPQLISEFEYDDQRKVNWVESEIDGVENYYYAYKYKVIVDSPITEYSMVFRLAEQYLIRAEAKVKQGNIVGAQQDVNIIRNRAGLKNITTTTQTELLDAILRERQLELFTEWGHRWLDLKRTGEVDNVLGMLRPNWKPTAALYPIPEEQILNSDWEQNPGY